MARGWSGELTDREWARQDRTLFSQRQRSISASSSLVSWAECPKKPTILRWLICRSRKHFLLLQRHVDQTMPKLLLSYWRAFQQWELQRHGLFSPFLARSVVGEPLGEVPQGLIQFPQPSLQ